LRSRSAGPALGPGGGDLFDELQPKLSELGADPYGSYQAMSINASFTFGVRLDGVDPSGIADDAVVLSRATQARKELTLPASPGDETPSLALAAECLGDVAAARIVPNNFTYVSGIGPDLFVMGIRAPTNDGPGEEVLCGVDAEAEDIEFYAGALDEQLDPEAIDVTTDEAVGEVFSSVEVDTLESSDDYAARAVMTLAEGAEPGAVFRGFDVGSVETYFGIQGPGSGVPAD